VARAVGLLVTAVISASVLGCGAAASAPPVTPAPVATAPPPPVLSDPASVDVVWRRLGSAGLRITANNAGRGQDGEPVKRINASYRDWPLVISQYSSGPALIEATKFVPDVPPVRGQPSYRLVGLNIFVEYGPSVTNDVLPPIPDDVRRDAALALVDVLAAILGPLQQSSIEPIPLPGAPAPVIAPAKPAPASAKPPASPAS
jgi:hypothetical protein